MNSRKLDFEGCFNARDLGGLTTNDGGLTQAGAIVRSDTLDFLTANGWAALEAYGIRTIIDLRNDGEVGTDASARPSNITTIRIPLDRGLHSGQERPGGHAPRRGIPVDGPEREATGGNGPEPRAFMARGRSGDPAALPLTARRNPPGLGLRRGDVPVRTRP